MSLHHFSREPDAAHARRTRQDVAAVSPHAMVAVRCKHGIRTALMACILVCTLALSTLAVPAASYAEVQYTDIVYGKTGNERGLSANELPDISARNAIVVDASGTVYFERSADDQVKIASITKVMTAIVALENAELSDIITVDNAAATVGESSAGLLEGDTLTLEEALHALLGASGNDAALAIASTMGAMIDPSSDDPTATFIQAMNDKAAELGMDNTLFENPHGLDFDEWEGNMHSSARDVATMLAYAMQNEDFREIDGSDRDTITVTNADGETRSQWMHLWNTILGEDGNIGGKTGTTYEALCCFAGTFLRDDEEVYVVVLGSEDDDARFNDALTLADWCYEHLTTAPVVTSTVTTAEGDLLVARATDTDWVDKTVDVIAADPDASVRLFDLGGTLTVDVDLTEFSGDVSVGEAAGTLTLLQDGEAIAQVDLVTAESIPAPSTIEWLLVQFDRFTRIFTGGDTVAESETVAVAPTV